MPTAIVHYWLLNMRGGERVLEALCRLLPDADIFTLFYDPERVSPALRSRNVQASFLNPLRRYYRSLLPLMPLALEQFDLRKYDLIVSSESGPSKGVLTPSAARHICYCHTPMRYLWEMHPAYQNELTRSRLKRVAMAPFTHYLRMWDYSTAARVDEFVANSENVRRRIWKTYRRDASVIYPPVAVESFYWKPPEDYFLAVAGLVAYKRLDTAVRVFSSSGRRLRIVGEGPEYRYLKGLATPNIEFCGHVSETELRELYARSRALVVPGEEDFGMNAVEALASGKPVVALGRGGVREAAPDSGPRCGVLYEEADETSLEWALARFEQMESAFRPSELQAFSRRFSSSEFDRQFRRVLEGAAVAARNT
jgi:glycosyltransferase involved in cell wall biosynthesis